MESCSSRRTVNTPTVLPHNVITPTMLPSEQRRRPAKPLVQVLITVGGWDLWLHSHGNIRVESRWCHQLTANLPNFFSTDSSTFLVSIGDFFIYLFMWKILWTDVGFQTALSLSKVRHEKIYADSYRDGQRGWSVKFFLREFCISHVSKMKARFFSFGINTWMKWRPRCLLPRKLNISKTVHIRECITV